jgi:hypothetical protein
MTDNPRGARHWARSVAPQPCIRLDPRQVQTMKQQMRFGSEAPRRRTHSRYGMQTMRLLGRRHLGSALARAAYREQMPEFVRIRD